MKRIIAVANQKGGVGKTTTNVNLATCLAQAGKRVLVADMDPQGNTTSGLGVDKHGLKKSIYTVLLGEAYLEEVTHSVDNIEGLHLLPANIDLAGAEIEMLDLENREFRLREVFNHAKYLYDYILIDCPPSLNILTLNALCAADTVLVPIQCEYYALEGLTQLMHTINLVHAKLNPRLALEGVVFTMYDARTNLSAQVVDEVKSHLEEHTYKTIIPRNVRLSEAPSHGLPITLYAPNSKGAEAYEQLAQEVIAKNFLGDKPQKELTK
ncbi:MAG: ParA family protein [Defluviitaleaceae bacterium]|nr:ParA family protein [Defluviitaleaceae bacterium]MCL2261801.1 ParA family protein [Defluviitaleaceae bacterium]